MREKRLIVYVDITSVSGYQSFAVYAEDEKAAAEKFKAGGEFEFLEEHVEVEGLDAESIDISLIHQEEGV